MVVGDKVEVTYEGEIYVGIVMPSTDENILQLKLENGYNIGLKKDKAKVKVVSKAGKPETVKYDLKTNKQLPNISLITTGGTITSKADYKTGGVHSLSKPEELLATIPELVGLANVRILCPFNVMSEDMSCAQWQKLAEVAADELNKKDVSGVIITHGTDILHYTSAILSFMLPELNKPVCLVGGQRSSDRGSFDGAENLICGVHYCLSNIAEVAIVMHGTTEDDYCLASRGTKVRKMHTSRRDAFRPINELPLAKIWKDGKIGILNANYKKRSENVAAVAQTKFDEKVALVKFAPGMSSDVINYYADKNYRGIIIEGTGFGHVASQPVKKTSSWLPAIKSAVKKGIFVGITSQCIYGQTNSEVYANLHLLKETGAVFLKDMLAEVAYVKLGWVLGNYKKDEVAKKMLENLAGEFSEHISEKGFLY